MSAVAEIPVYADRVNPAIDEFCGAGMTCELVNILADICLIFTVGLALGTVVGSVAYIKSAKAAVKTERSRTLAERKAFEGFARRVAQMTSVTVTTRSQSPAAAISVMEANSPRASSLNDVREAYRNTVMDLSHYDEDYGEPLEDNMALELGDDIATIVRNSDQLTPQLQQALISMANQTASSRGSLLAALDREDESLNEARETFDAVQSTLTKYQPETLRGESYSSLPNLWEELDSLEDRCASALATRQRRLRNEPMNKDEPSDKPSLFQYLYDSLQVDYPVLATGTAFIDQIETSRRTLARVASNRR